MCKDKGTLELFLGLFDHIHTKENAQSMSVELIKGLRKRYS